MNTKKLTQVFDYWSGREDSNLRPLAPHAMHKTALHAIFRQCFCLNLSNILLGKRADVSRANAVSTSSIRWIFSAIIACLFVSKDYAADLELSIGKTANTHELSYSIGVVGEAFGQEVRAGYANLGSNNMGSPVAPDDYADDQMAGWGDPPCHWLKQKERKELYLTVDPVIYRGTYLWQAELGAAAFHPQWQQDICVNYYNEPAHAYGNPWGITPIFGVVVGDGDGKTSVALDYQNITERGDWENSAPKSAVINLSVRRRF